MSLLPGMQHSVVKKKAGPDTRTGLFTSTSGLSFINGIGVAILDVIGRHGGVGLEFRQ